MAVAAGCLSRICKTKNKVKGCRTTEFRRGIQGLDGKDRLAKELSRREEAAAEELYSLNPENID
jgi:hypothetical protein